MHDADGSAGGATLEGITVGIPAARRADETAALVRRWGGIPLVGPTLVEIPLLEDVALKEATEQVVSSPARWSIHLTGVGTRRWFDAAEGWGLAEELRQTLTQANVIARGSKAKAALKTQGLDPVWVPPGETSEEIAQWVAPRLQAADAVAIQHHGSPVPTLEGAVRSTGARAINVAPYRWELPADLAPARRLVSAVISGGVQALVVTSAPQIRHLFVIAEQMGAEAELRRALRDRVFVGAVGVVARGGVEEQGLEADLVADPPRMGALVRALAGARDRILAKAAAPSGTEASSRDV